MLTLLARIAGMAVFDTMRHIRPNVSTVCVGLAASMGAFLLASGQQVRAVACTKPHVALASASIGGADVHGCSPLAIAHSSVQCLEKLNFPILMTKRQVRIG